MANKEYLLSQIADAGYDVGFGAKKHFATFDIVEKTPGWIGLVSMGVGVFALFVDCLATQHISAVLIVLGICGLLINSYSEVKQNYEKVGKHLTQLFNELKALYFHVKSSGKIDFSEEEEKLSAIKSDFFSSCISKQILFSDWYAHYKFFWQHQIDWIDEQKQFSFFRDKVPLSFYGFVFLVIVGLGGCFFYLLF
ncbi:MAG: SLATT domain-containing protein [Thermodesulfobacteriota bacterium]|nr:SLATT domain-containing protein [Thermodesulfobacteriota bacterium]